MNGHEPSSRQEVPTEDGAAASELLLRIADAARVLGIGRTTFYKLIGDGDIHVVRIGRAVRVPLTELHAFVARQPGVRNTYPGNAFPHGTAFRAKRSSDRVRSPETLEP
jgi:excisionase family DNA binding protein